MKLILFLCILPIVYCEFQEIPIMSCGEGFEDLPCEIHQVSVDDCEVFDGKCELVRGLPYKMDMQFTPQFEGSDFKLLAYALIGDKELPFEGMNSNACDFMKCPVEKGARQSYIFNVEVGVSKPRGSFKTRWLMTQNGENKCCFVNDFRLL